MALKRLEKNLRKLSAAELFARYEEANQEYIKGFVPEFKGAARGRLTANRASGIERQRIVDEFTRRYRSRDREVLDRLNRNLKSSLGAHESGVLSNRRTSNFGENIRRLRNELGWSADTLAKKSGLDKKQVLSHEHGANPYPKTKAIYAETFSKGFSEKHGSPKKVTVQELDSDPKGGPC